MSQGVPGEMSNDLLSNLHRLLVYDQIGSDLPGQSSTLIIAPRTGRPVATGVGVSFAVRKAGSQ